MVFIPMLSAQPSSLSIRFGIEGVRLPHFQFVDGGRGDVVGPDEPGLSCVPLAGGLFGPSLRLGRNVKTRASARR